MLSPIIATYKSARALVERPWLSDTLKVVMCATTKQTRKVGKGTWGLVCTRSSKGATIRSQAKSRLLPPLKVIDSLSTWGDSERSWLLGTHCPCCIKQKPWFAGTSLRQHTVWSLRCCQAQFYWLKSKLYNMTAWVKASCCYSKHWSFGVPAGARVLLSAEVQSFSSF